jgi:hypothetical protein
MNVASSKHSKQCHRNILSMQVHQGISLISYRLALLFNQHLHPWSGRPADVEADWIHEDSISASTLDPAMVFQQSWPY